MQSHLILKACACSITVANWLASLWKLPYVVCATLGASAAFGHLTFRYSSCFYLQLPLQQLAWMISDIGCRIIITGKGTAGAIAQEATLQLQQLVRAQSTGQVSPKISCVITEQ